MCAAFVSRVQVVVGGLWALGSRGRSQREAEGGRERQREAERGMWRAVRGRGRPREEERGRERHRKRGKEKYYKAKGNREARINLKCGVRVSQRHGCS